MGLLAEVPASNPLRGARLEAYAWFSRALLVSILLLLVSVQLMARQERRRPLP